MVRLKLHCLVSTWKLLTFQFQYGAIKIGKVALGVAGAATFQFQYGAIKIHRLHR